MAEIRNIIGSLKEYAEEFKKSAIVIREMNSGRSYTAYILSETCRQAAEELERLVPVPPDMEGGGTTWFYVCGECHGQIDRADGFCRHCGRPTEWN